MVLVICWHDCMVVWNIRNAKIMAGQIVGFSTAAGECLPDKSYFDRSVPCKLSSMLQNRDLNVLACWTWNCWGWLTCKIFGGVSPMQATLHDQLNLLTSPRLMYWVKPGELSPFNANDTLGHSLFSLITFCCTADWCLAVWLTSISWSFPCDKSCSPKCHMWWCFCRLPTRPCAPSCGLPRRPSRTAPSPSGSVCVQATPSG